MESLTSIAAKDSFLRRRALGYKAIREWFDRQGFLEVQVPPLSDEFIPEAHIEAFQAGGHFLLSSPELYMKQLLAAGFERIYAIGPAFRRGEYGPWHQPCFELLEWYRRDGELVSLGQDLEGLVLAAAEGMGTGTELQVCGHPVKLGTGFDRVDLCGLIARDFGWDPSVDWDADRFDLLMAEHVEPGLGHPRPVLLSGWPAAQAALAELDPDDPAKALRLELYIGGVELANGFQELRDPGLQRARFEALNTRRMADGLPVCPLPEQFLRALAGLPRAAGMALGLDRLMAVLLSAGSLEEILPFTLPAPAQEDRG